MAPGSNGSLTDAAHAVYDILPRPTATTARAAGASALDLAPAGGVDFLVVAVIAVIIAVVLVLILRSRRRS